MRSSTCLARFPPHASNSKMNATPILSLNPPEENNTESDADTNPEGQYQPISAVDQEDQDHSLVNGHLPIDNINEDEEEGEEEEEEREREERESAIRRAFREDEERRNAPLSEENAARVMEAMRGVSFGGLAPDWVGRVPEEEWIHRLRRLREPPGAPSSNVNN